MLNEKTVRGTNFTSFHAGPMEGWAQFRLEPPDVPLPAKGKLFLRKFLGSAGLEMSLNVVPPGKAMPFLHKHQQNDELYVVVRKVKHIDRSTLRAYVAKLRDQSASFGPADRFVLQRLEGLERWAP